MPRPPFQYDPQKLPRELKPFYIGASDSEMAEMLSTLGLDNLDQLFGHIDPELKGPRNLSFEGPFQYEQLADHLYEISQKNAVKACFIGDGLSHYSTPSFVPDLCSIRKLTTAYTPYQPERCQGTLISLWVYASALAKLTGFEAINASLYDRSTCLFEALNCATRAKKGRPVVLVSSTHFPGDLEVLKTLSAHTDLVIKIIRQNPETGLTDTDHLIELIGQNASRTAALAFPQINHMGLIENVDLLTDTAHQNGLLAIAAIDPILLGQDGLKPPSEYGEKGADIIVGEGQHLALGPNFGGPGLGIFGVRFNADNKNLVRQAPGRYVGQAIDRQGREAKTIVLSTREQHIRREKATSNICSNQSFVATLAGACLLARGEKGLGELATSAHHQATQLAQKLTQYPGVSLAYPHSPFWNEFVLSLPSDAAQAIDEASDWGVQIGVDVSLRAEQSTSHLLKVSCFDHHSDSDVEKITRFFTHKWGQTSDSPSPIAPLPPAYKRTTPAALKAFSQKELLAYYRQLGEQNVSPDESIYPLGSCTMKYNPYINDWAAALEGFTKCHPQAPLKDVQGCLEILYAIQEDFKAITGLPHVTTQPVAGAQGELVGLKMFQAYHREKNPAQERDIILIPRSAHGTNPATATYAGFKAQNIKIVEANANGELDLEQLTQLVHDFGPRICGIMITNPNTAGIFEGQFKTVAELIHRAGGLVYMDGANLNAIAGHIDLDKMGVDAVHSNLHKTWTIPHGGGGPGDAIVAISETLKDFLPGVQIEKEGEAFKTTLPKKSIGSVHRHFGNFAHKVRAYTYLKALGPEGVKKMSATATLAAQYLFHRLKDKYPSLPRGASKHPRMHEFILTLTDQTFEKLAKANTPKAQALAKLGKLYLDFGMHAPTVAFPEPFGLMIEPTESYSKKELDRFCTIIDAIYQLLEDTPEVLQTVPHFTPVLKIDEVKANRELCLCGPLDQLPELFENRTSPDELMNMPIEQVKDRILQSHRELLSNSTPL